MNFKNIIITLLWAAFFYTTPVMPSDPVTFSEPVENLFHPQGLQGELVEKKKMVEDAYYELVKNDHFDNLYINNVIIDLNLKGGVEKEGMILLGLIEWLARQKDTQSVHILKKLNDLYFLEFTRFIVSLDSSKTRSTDMLEDFQALYHYSTHNEELGEVEPFRSTLSKLILLIHMVNEGELHYEGRKETLALALDKLKSEMLRINEVFGEVRLERSIKSFVTLLEVYAVRDPLIKPRSMKKIVWGTIGIALVVFLIYKIALNRETIKSKINEGIKYVRDDMVKPVFRGMVEVLIEVLAERRGEHGEHPPLFEDIGRQLIHGMVVDTGAQPNLDGSILGQNIVRGAVAGLGLDPATVQPRIDTVVEAVGNIGLLAASPAIPAALDRVGRLAEDPVGIRSAKNMVKGWFGYGQPPQPPPPA